MSTTWKRRPYVATSVDDVLIVLDLDRLIYHELNQSASAVWEMLSEEQTEQTLSEGLMQRYEVSAEQCQRSVHRLLLDLQTKNLADKIENKDRVLRDTSTQSAS